MEINVQPISKIDRSNTDKLLIHSIFKTIQGEGIFAGHPAVFLRLGGCNLQCPMCDTEYTKNTINLKVDTILKEIIKIATPNRLVVITGGEPFRQNLQAIVQLLLTYDFKVQIETNGTIYDQDFNYYKAVTIICSPKTGKVNKKLQPYIDAYKYVISSTSYDETDGLPTLALDHPAHPVLFRPPSNAKIFLQAADERDYSLTLINTKLAATLCKQFGYIFCLQIHKVIGEE